MDEREKLQAAFNEARAKARREPTPENREAAKAAWKALEEATPRAKARGYASRAGQRQAAQRRAEQIERERRGLDRRWKES